MVFFNIGMRYGKILAVSSVLAASMPAAADWSYRKDEDKMSGKNVESALLRSTNSLDLDFPYKGINYGTLQIRKHPKFGTDVIFYVDKGQVLCSTYSGCPINVRFDDEKQQTYTGTPSSDHDSTTVFLTNNKKFIASAVKAKRILIQPNIYRGGSPILEFNSAKPLEWKSK